MEAIQRCNAEPKNHIKMRREEGPGDWSKGKQRSESKLRSLKDRKVAEQPELCGESGAFTAKCATYTTFDSVRWQPRRRDGLEARCGESVDGGEYTFKINRKRI